MPNIATVLKQEITRLARREVNAQTKVIRKASAQYRRDIAELKRQVAALSKQVMYLERQDRKRASKGAPKVSIEGRRFSARGLQAHRNIILPFPSTNTTQTNIGLQSFQQHFSRWHVIDGLWPQRLALWRCDLLKDVQVGPG